MKLAEMTWQDVEAFSKNAVVLIPTGSIEQHGPHLPLFTDSLIVTSVAQAVESGLRQEVLLTPTLWLGASGHHLKFPGSLSATFESYIGSLGAVVDSLIPHGFSKFFILNGHGGNNDPNGVALRSLKAKYPDFTFGHSGYYAFIETEIAETLEGPMKHMAHACEAEASLMLYLHPDLVRSEKLRDDGLKPEHTLLGMVHHFDEISEEGSLGYAKLATAKKGEHLFKAAVGAVARQLQVLAAGYVLTGIVSSE